MGRRGIGEQSYVTPQLTLSKCLQFLVGGSASMEVTMEEVEIRTSLLRKLLVFATNMS
jgi:hypothetical protein